MNERIRELVEQSRVQDRGYFIYQYGGPTGHQSVEKAIDLEKFAELIVRECAVYCEGHILPRGMAEQNDLDYNDGIMDCAIGLKTIFGIE